MQIETTFSETWSGDERPWDSCELEFFRGLVEVLS